MHVGNKSVLLFGITSSMHVDLHLTTCVTEVRAKNTEQIFIRDTIVQKAEPDPACDVLVDLGL